MDESYAYQLHLQIQQARYLAEIVDPFWDEGDPESPGNTPARVLSDLDAAMDRGEGRLDVALDDLAARWHIPDQDSDDARRQIVARHVQAASIARDLAELVTHGEIDGATTWSEVIALYGDDEAADAAVRATAHAAAALGMDGYTAIAREVPAYVVLEIYSEDDVTAAVAQAVDHGADIAPLVHRYGPYVDPIRLAAALRISPEELVRMSAPPPGIDLA